MRCCQLGKHLDAQIKRENKQRFKVSIEKYKGPYDCPKCFKPKAMSFKLLEKKEKTNVWLVICNKCNYWKKIEFSNNLGDIDLYNKINDIIRSEHKHD